MANVYRYFGKKQTADRLSYCFGKGKVFNKHKVKQKDEFYSKNGTPGGQKMGKRRMDDNVSSRYESHAAQGGAIIGLVIGIILLVILKILGINAPALIVLLGSVLIVAAIFVYIQKRTPDDGRGVATISSKELRRRFDNNQKDFSNLDLSGFDLHEEHLQGKSFRGSILHDQNLEGKDLSGTEFQDADLSHTKLKSAQMTGAIFYGTNLYGADLENANLTGAHLQGANLCCANLKNAILSDAHLQHTNFEQANLRKATDIDPEQLLKSESLDGATMPDGIILTGFENPTGPSLEEWIENQSQLRKQPTGID